MSVRNEMDHPFGTGIHEAVDLSFGTGVSNINAQIIVRSNTRHLDADSNVLRIPDGASGTVSWAHLGVDYQVSVIDYKPRLGGRGDDATISYGSTGLNKTTIQRKNGGVVINYHGLIRATKV